MNTMKDMITKLNGVQSKMEATFRKELSIKSDDFSVTILDNGFSISLCDEDNVERDLVELKSIDRFIQDNGIAKLDLFEGTVIDEDGYIGAFAFYLT